MITSKVVTKESGQLFKLASPIRGHNDNDTLNLIKNETNPVVYVIFIMERNRSKFKLVDSDLE